MKPSSQGSSEEDKSTEMTLVPRKKYELLVELYSTTYAEQKVKSFLQEAAQGKPEYESMVNKIEDKFEAKKE
jgi:hypothetical protein